MYFLPPTEKPFFPPVEEANEDGLLAIGGKLTSEWLLEAYSRGIFPWFNEGEFIMWWSPEPRAVMKPYEVKVQKSMRPYFNKKKYELRIDTNFEQVINYCAKISREGQPGTWINSMMIESYNKLHKEGFVHSFETYENGELIGGLYGVSLGKAFFGESMFSLKPNASKFAFISMCRILEHNHFLMIDCQMPTNHLKSLGCKTISKKKFNALMTKNNNYKNIIGNWSLSLLKIT